MDRLRRLPLGDIRIQDAFWDQRVRLIREKVIPYQWQTLNDLVPDATPSHCIRNFEVAAGRAEGEFQGMVFQDSDLYKWLESVAFSLQTQPDPELERIADGAIELIGAAQEADGYLNTYFTIKFPEKRWTNLQQAHELYCAGHLIEAAVAYHQATGKRALLDVAIRFADCIDRAFGPEPEKLHGYPGHQEVELALVKLFEATNDARYLRLARYFLDVRGADGDYFSEESGKKDYPPVFPVMLHWPCDYNQSHMKPALQREATGHAVRAGYMYTAMADVAALTGDAPLREACEALYQNIAGRQMYVTGAIGSSAIGERFSFDYDLPSELIYGETCASISLMMFCQRMLRLTRDMRYADTMERALYNSVLSCVSLSGTEFFYVNPLSVDPERCKRNPVFEHIEPIRQRWFGCSCCPPNLARTVMSLGHYMFSADADSLYVNLYVSSEAEVELADGARRIRVDTDYPYGGSATIRVTGGRARLYLRSPGCAPIVGLRIAGQDQPFEINNGALALERDFDGEPIELKFDLRPRLIYSDPRVSGNIGKIAVMRGPLVYCAEQIDNGEGVARILLKADTVFTEIPPPEGLPAQTVALQADAWKCEIPTDAGLYTETPPTLAPIKLTLIPYFLWANRGEGQMEVWIKTDMPGA